MNKDHKTRVKQELREAGISRYAAIRAEGRYLPKIIHPNERIMAAVYGRIKGESAMLVATDKRLIYLDKRPIFNVSEDISYDVVAGIRQNNEGELTSSITVFTRVGDYRVNHATQKSASIFKTYIENKVLEDSQHVKTRDAPLTVSPGKVDKPEESSKKLSLDKPAADFLRSHELGVISTIGRSNTVHGSAVYYVLDEDNACIYFLTKSGTKKAHNIMSNSITAFTVYDEPNLTTVQIDGKACIENDQTIKQRVFDKIHRLRNYGNEKHHPPVTKLVDGSFIIFRLNIVDCVYHNFKYSR